MNGMVALVHRGAIVSEVRADRTSAEIAEFHNIPISAVKKVTKLYNDSLASGGKDMRSLKSRGRSTGAAVIPIGAWRPLEPDPGGKLRTDEDVCLDIGFLG